MHSLIWEDKILRQTGHVTLVEVGTVLASCCLSFLAKQSPSLCSFLCCSLCVTPVWIALLHIICMWQIKTNSVLQSKIFNLFSSSPVIFVHFLQYRKCDGPVQVSFIQGMFNFSACISKVCSSVNSLFTITPTFLNFPLRLHRVTPSQL